MIRKLPSVGVIALAALMIVAGLSGCKQTNTGNPAETGADNLNLQSSNKPTPRTTFEQDLQFIRNNHYTYVWIFSRKDGKPFEKEDGDYLHQNAPNVLDWVATDGGKRYIGGCNFDLEPETWKLLRKRFVVENYSGK